MIASVGQKSSRQVRWVHRAMLAGIVVALAAMWVSIGYFIVASRAARIEEEQKALVRMARVVREQTLALFSLLDYFLVSADVWFKKHPDADPRTDRVFAELVETFRARTSGMIDIRLVSARGELFYLGRGEGKPLANVADRDYFQAQFKPETRGLFVAKPVLSRVTGNWGLPISYPLASVPGGIAVIFAAIENRALAKSYEEARTKPNGTILLAHQDGTILFRTPEANLIGKSLASGSDGARKLPLDGEGVFNIDGATDGVARIGAFTSVPGYPLVVSVSSATADAMKIWQSRSIGLALFGGVVTLAGVALLWRLSGSLRILAMTRRQLEELALIDDLTGIANRRQFMEQSRLELARARRYRHALSVLVYDVDHFKAVNDGHGHEIGDRVLKAVTRVAQNDLRATDVHARIGGEEFAVLLPETDREEAWDVAERLRESIEKQSVAGRGGEAVRVSVSVGVATLMEQDSDLDQLLVRADSALYCAKNAGRNRVCESADTVRN